MKARIASTLALWATVSAALYFGGALAGLALLVIMGAAAQWEFYTLLEKLGAAPRKALGLVVGALLPIAVFLKGSGLAARLQGDEAAAPTLGELKADMVAFALAGVAVALVFFVQLARHSAPLKAILRAPTAFGVLGFPLMMSLYAWPAGIHWGRNGDLTGVYWVVWCVAATKFTDVGGLLAGKAFGRNKLWPAVSPGKTWEGCLGGVLTSAGVAAALAVLFAKLGWTIELPPAKAALLALPLAVLSVPSDLVESVFKRLTGVKDSGHTIPGIGGAYDLLDSLLLTAPVSLGLYLAVTA